MMERASRAEALAHQTEAAHDPLVFLGAVLRTQSDVARHVESIELSGVLGRDVTRVLPSMRAILHTIAEHPTWAGRVKLTIYGNPYPASVVAIALASRLTFGSSSNVLCADVCLISMRGR